MPEDAWAEERRRMGERCEAASPLTVTALPDGTQTAHLPLPQKALFSAAMLGMLAGEVFETVITTHFANGTARWRVVGANDYGVLVAKRIADTEAGGA